AAPPPEFHTLSLHDALPISVRVGASQRTTSPPAVPPARSRPSGLNATLATAPARLSRTWTGRSKPRSHSRTVPSSQPAARWLVRSEEHTSELQSLTNLVCPL